MAVARFATQMLTVTLLVGIAILITDALSFQSGWNVLWMVGIPFGVARLVDREGSFWPLIGLYLLLWAMFSMGAIAVLLGIGP